MMDISAADLLWPLGNIIGLLLGVILILLVRLRGRPRWTVVGWYGGHELRITGTRETCAEMYVYMQEAKVFDPIIFILER